MNKNSMTINEFYIFLWIAFVAIAFLFNNVPLWKARYEFSRMTGYIKHGTITAYDSTLRIPDEHLKNKTFTEYCQQIHDVRISKKIKYFVGDGPQEEVYCGCLVKHDDVIEYKLFDNRIVYLCQHEILSTILIPAVLQGKSS